MMLVGARMPGIRIDIGTIRQLRLGMLVSCCGRRLLRSPKVQWDLVGPVGNVGR